MIGLVGAGIVESVSAASSPALDLGRGAIAGAFVAGAAFLAGYAAIRRSGLAICALFMVLGAAALEFSWLGVVSSLAPDVRVLILGLFAATTVVFLSASIGAAKYNPLLGGLMFTAALVLGGMGFINFIDRIDLTNLMRWSAIGVGGFAVLLAITQALRGDDGARLILPGIAIAVAAPFVGSLTTVEPTLSGLAPHGLFTLGILAASIVALSDGGASGAMAPDESVPLADAARFAPEQPARRPAPRQHADTDPNARRARERAEIVLDSQLAKVLDYAGLAIWDWSPEAAEQTESLPFLLGADSGAPFTPEALRGFIAKEDVARFDSEIMKPEDGPFDASLSLFDGRIVRIRGARAAADEEGALERIVAIVEAAAPSVKGAKSNRGAAPMPAALSAQQKRIADAVRGEEIIAAFQPIVSLPDATIVGYEALARWNAPDGAAVEGEAIVDAAEAAGVSDLLAKRMLAQASAFLAKKRKAGAGEDLFVAMNVSWKQMSAPAFLSEVARAISQYALPKKSLVLELTEGDAVTDERRAGGVFSALTDAGAGLAFDDFGAGFSCLSNLRRYDFDYLKIDKSFAVDLERDGDGAKIIGGLASIGDRLGLKVIIEGVETMSAAKAAAALGCAYGQGFALGRPAGDKSTSPPSPKSSPGEDRKPSDRVAEAKSQKETDAIASAPPLDAPAKVGRWRRGDMR